MPMTTQEFGPHKAVVSRIALGCMGMAGTGNPAEVGPDNVRRAVAAFEAALEVGITFYDHADIYGGTACESIFKECLAAVPGARERIFIATKVGIRPGFYDHRPDYIRSSILGSMERLGVDSVDLYQLHRPDPLSHPARTAEVLDQLVAQGLVKSVGVSNYYPHQVSALQKYLHAPIASNQISLSLLRLDPIYEGAAGQTDPAKPGGAGDGVLDQCLELGITPLAYSPLGGGWLSGRKPVPADDAHAAIRRTLDALQKLGPAYGGATPTRLALAWLLAHPSQIIPLVGSNDPAHIREAARAADITLSREDWYALWVASRGAGVP